MLLIASLLLLAPTRTPSLPPGCDLSFANRVLAVESKLEKGDFKSAQILATGLPGRKITIAWSDKGLGTGEKAPFMQARNRAIEAWRKAVPSLTIQAINTSVKANIDVSFVKNIASTSSDLFIPAAKHSVSQEGSRAVRSSIALSRGAKSEPINAKDVENEMLYAIGLYLGLGHAPLYTEAMGRTEQPSRSVAKVTTDEAKWASECLSLAEYLRTAVGQRTKVNRARAVVQLEKVDPKETETVQGDHPIYHVTLGSMGSAPVRYRIESTCACISAVRTGTIEPGQTGTIEVELDTTEFEGKLSKTLFIITNDAEQGTLEVPIVSHITPRYRIISPLGSSHVMEKGNYEFDIYLVLHERAHINPYPPTIEGINAQITVSKWEGELADPERGEPATFRKGYRYHIVVKSDDFYGRRLASLSIPTDNLEVRTLLYGFSVQSGIVVLPSSLYFGQTKVGATVDGLLSQPGKPFEIVGYVCDQPFLAVEFADTKIVGQKKVLITIKEGAPKGVFKAYIKAKTNSSSQPEVVIGVGGVIK